MNEEKLLLQTAVELFGADRTQELRPEVEQLAREIASLYTYEIGFDDEP
jgi:hypothetical protein